MKLRRNVTATYVVRAEPEDRRPGFRVWLDPRLVNRLGHRVAGETMGELEVTHPAPRQPAPQD